MLVKDIGEKCYILNVCYFVGHTEKFSPTYIYIFVFTNILFSPTSLQPFVRPLTFASSCTSSRLQEGRIVWLVHTSSFVQAPYTVGLKSNIRALLCTYRQMSWKRILNQYQQSFSEQVPSQIPSQSSPNYTAQRR